MQVVLFVAPKQSKQNVCHCFSEMFLILIFCSVLKRETISGTGSGNIEVSYGKSTSVDKFNGIHHFPAELEEERGAMLGRYRPKITTEMEVLLF